MEVKDYIVTLSLFVCVWVGGFLVSSFVFNPPTCVSMDVCDYRLIIGVLLTLGSLVFITLTGWLEDCKG